MDVSSQSSNMVSPYKITKSVLGTTTKILNDKFICSSKELQILFSSFRDKIDYFNPTDVGFQYLISFTDKTHYENDNLSLLERNLSSTGKCTDKLVLNWNVVHDHAGEENELSITVRISNPINPFLMLQAALSRNPDDVDNIEMEMGSVFVSVTGATQAASEEIFELVGRWIDSCPQPQSITKLNSFLAEHREKVFFLNKWLLPVIYSYASFLFLQKQLLANAVAYSFLFLCGFLLLRSLVSIINRRIDQWCGRSKQFSLFMLTGGDDNQQTKLSARATNSTIKLVLSVIASFLINLSAGFVVLLLS